MEDKGNELGAVLERRRLGPLEPWLGSSPGKSPPRSQSTNRNLDEQWARHIENEVRRQVEASIVTLSSQISVDGENMLFSDMASRIGALEIYGKKVGVLTYNLSHVTDMLASEVKVWKEQQDKLDNPQIGNTCSGDSQGESVEQEIDHKFAVELAMLAEQLQKEVSIREEKFEQVSRSICEQLEPLQQNACHWKKEWPNTAGLIDDEANKREQSDTVILDEVSGLRSELSRTAQLITDELRSREGHDKKIAEEISKLREDLSSTAEEYAHKVTSCCAASMETSGLVSALRDEFLGKLLLEKVSAHDAVDAEADGGETALQIVEQLLGEHKQVVQQLLGDVKNEACVREEKERQLYSEVGEKIELLNLQYQDLATGLNDANEALAQTDKLFVVEVARLQGSILGEQRDRERRDTQASEELSVLRDDLAGVSQQLGEVTGASQAFRFRKPSDCLTHSIRQLDAGFEKAEAEQQRSDTWPNLHSNPALADASRVRAGQATPVATPMPKTILRSIAEDPNPHVGYPSPKSTTSQYSSLLASPKSAGVLQRPVRLTSSGSSSRRAGLSPDMMDF